MAMRGAGLRRVQKGVDQLTPFMGSNISGRRTWLGQFGRLPNVWQDVLRDQSDRVNYVIYSYGTPIAWHVPDGSSSFWVIPEVTYSVTTTNHQNVVRVATEHRGFYAERKW